MKKSLLFLSFIAWLLIGCNQKGGPIQSTSPNGETTITISGEKLWADPWKTTISAKRKGFEEFYQQAKGMGVGNSLMQAIIGDAEEQGFWTLQSGIFPENAASVRLHEKFGFRTVGRRERIGQMRDGRWRDIILMERRSQTVGK